MNTRISVPLSEIDENFLKKLKEDYPHNSRLDIQIINLDELPVFSEEDFWEIIAQLDWEADSRDAVLAPAVSTLAAHAISHIYLFEDILDFILKQFSWLKTRLLSPGCVPGKGT